MYAAVSRFVVKNDVASGVADSSRYRPHQVDSTSGFRRMEVISPADAPNGFRLIVFRENEASFRTGHRRHAHKASHAAVPEGLKLAPDRTRLRVFTLACG